MRRQNTKVAIYSYYSIRNCSNQKDLRKRNSIDCSDKKISKSLIVARRLGTNIVSTTSCLCEKDYLVGNWLEHCKIYLPNSFNYILNSKSCYQHRKYSCYDHGASPPEDTVNRTY